MSETDLPKVTLAHLPTPVRRLERLSESLGGPEIWIKRDDLTGLSMGGNKVRKLEYLVGEALARGSDTLITTGAVQSNHCRQTAGAAARFGLHCILVLRGDEPSERRGNLLLDDLLGAELIFTGGDDANDARRIMAEQASKPGRNAYEIPSGGSNAVGAVAYAVAMREFLSQGVEVDRIVVATSSGGTLSGLLAGAELYGFSGKLTGVRIYPAEGSTETRLATHAQEAAGLLGSPIELDPAQIDVRQGYHGPGYAVVTALERQAMEIFARQEGVLLDPVYTGRTAGGMLDLIDKGEIGADERVLLWHTGGTPAIFAFGNELLA